MGGNREVGRRGKSAAVRRGPPISIVYVGKCRTKNDRLEWMLMGAKNCCGKSDDKRKEGRKEGKREKGKVGGRRRQRDAGSRSDKKNKKRSRERSLRIDAGCHQWMQDRDWIWHRGKYDCELRTCTHPRSSPTKIAVYVVT